MLLETLLVVRGSAEALRMLEVRLRPDVEVAPCDGGRKIVEGLRVVGVAVRLARVCDVMRFV